MAKRSANSARNEAIETYRIQHCWWIEHTFATMKLQDNLILVPMLATLSSSVDGANHVGIHSLSSQNVKLTSERVQHASHSTGAPISHRQLTPRGTRGIKYRSRRRREQEEEDIDVSNPNETRKIGSLRKRKKKGSRSNVSSRRANKCL